MSERRHGSVKAATERRQSPEINCVDSSPNTAIRNEKNRIVIGEYVLDTRSYELITPTHGKIRLTPVQYELLTPPDVPSRRNLFPEPLCSMKSGTTPPIPAARTWCGCTSRTCASGSKRTRARLLYPHGARLRVYGRPGIRTLILQRSNLASWTSFPDFTNSLFLFHSRFIQ